MKISLRSTWMAAAVLCITSAGCSTARAPDHPPVAPSPVEKALEPVLALRRSTLPALLRPGERHLSHEITANGCEITERSVHSDSVVSFVRDRTDHIDLAILDTSTVRVESQVRQTFHGVKVNGVSGIPALRWEARFWDFRDGKRVDGSEYSRSAQEPEWELWFPEREMAVRAGGALKQAIALCQGRANRS